MVAAIGIAAAAVALWLFPRALPILSLDQRLTREQALARADSFFRAHDLASANARTAVRFERSDSLRTFIELAGGGSDSLNALVRGRDATVFVWSVRAFVPGDVREARVDFSPDGRVIGFERKLAEADARPTLTADSARRIAEQMLATWVAPRAGAWALVGSSYQTRKTSNRVDHTFTFERTDRRIAGAPMRIEAVIAGDTPARVNPFVEVPQSFVQRYGEMRSWNELLSLLANIGILAVALAGMIGLARFARAREVRWREAMTVGGVIGALMLAAALNELPGSWFFYDTAVSPATFRVEQVMAALVFGISTALMTGVTLAAAEVATRHAFPRQLDWWKLWRFRGTREVAANVGGGYVVAAIAFAYVALFYVVTRTVFGWWTPSEMLDDPNQIASPMPWISGLAISVNAGVWEEALFRALPLSLLSLWVGDRPARKWWMAGGVVVTALVFGFAHANYESWPPYSRGVEIFLDACFWAFLFLRFGLLVTVVAHFVYDAVLFGIFAAQGSAPEYRLTAAIILVALLAPAAIVLWRRVRQGAFVPAPQEATFAAWAPGTERVAEPVAVERSTGALSSRAQRLALAAASVGLVLSLALPDGPALGPEFTATRARTIQVADSMLRATGADASGWRRLTDTGSDTVQHWRRFLAVNDIEGDAQRYAATYAIPTWWIVRYVRTTGTSSDRIEEWRVRVLPDGRPLDVRHVVPDSLEKDTANPVVVRQIARAALARAGIDTTPLRESDVTEVPRPRRRDVTLRYTDTMVKLPGGAAARAYVDIAGNEPLVARRFVELPEAFVRAERQRQSAHVAAFGVVTFVLIALIVVGGLVVRRHAVLVDDGHLGRRDSLIFLLATFALTVANRLNRLPGELFGYDTSQPWNNFLGSTALSFVSDGIFAFVLFGLWLGLNGLRRRVGVPMLADAPRARREALVAGFGIAGVAASATALMDVMKRTGGIPPTPTTSLNSVVPWLDGVLVVPEHAVQMVALAGIPLLVIAGITRRWALRIGMVVLAGGAVAALSWIMGSRDDARPELLAFTVIAGTLVAAALVHWGTHSAWSWYVAALSVLAFGALRAAIWGAVWQERIAAVLIAVTATALVAAIARWAHRLDGVDAGTLPTPSPFTVATP